MMTYTYSEARQQLAALLDEARRAGRVQIRRRDGQLFVLQPATQERSPLDVPGVSAGLVAGESAAWLREEREAEGDRLLQSALSVGTGVDPEARKVEIWHWLETEVWPLAPEELRGKPHDPRADDEILGYGADGVPA